MKQSLPILLLFLLAQGIQAQQLPTQILHEAIPAKTGLFSNLQWSHKGGNGPADNLASALNQAFDSICGLSPIKGFNAAIRLPDGTYWKRSHGVASEAGATSVPLTPNHLMGMGSITKTFVSTTLLLMAQDGLLSLNDSIGKYLQPYPQINPNAKIWQLLSHRTGFNDYLNENPATLQAFNQHLDSIWVADTILNNYVLAPNFPLDSTWSYSNTNFLLAGRIIENITGKHWYEVVRERILTPYGLTHTFAYPWEMPGTQPIAHVFLDVDGNGTIDDFQGYGLPLTGFFSLAGSAGCLMTTTEDLDKFMERLFSGNILNAASLFAMQTDHVQNPAFGLKYGLGAFSFISLPLNNWGHNGSVLYESIALYFPDDHFALSVQQNDARLGTSSNPIVDLNDVFVNLLLTYLENAQVSAVVDVDAGLKVAVYPNPVSDILHIQLPADYTGRLNYTLTDLLGHKIISATIAAGATDVPVQHLAPGVYFLTVGGKAQRIVIDRP